MVPLGYRVVGMLGCVMYGAGLFVSSWLTKDQGDLAGFLIGGLAGLGSTFLFLTAVVPPLEYFTKKRLCAIAIVRSGQVIGVEGMLFLYFHTRLMEDNSLVFKWEHNFRYQLIPLGVAFLCCTTLTPLELRCSDSRESFAGRIIQNLDWKFLKDKLLYLILALAFLERLGKQLVLNRYKDLIDTVDRANSNAKGILSNYPGLGEVFGLGLLASCCCCRGWKTKTVLITLGVLNIWSGVAVCLVPTTNSFVIVASCGAYIGLCKGLFSSLIDNTIPDTFGNRNVRIVEGALWLAAGIAEIVLIHVQDAIFDTYGSRIDLIKASFYVGGGLMILTGKTAIITGCQMSKT
ncbi:uncharacterized protein [Argopecten irradians]|uniref:uncharacterized protein n=1 Tax=Argopecten irradians TaxID=31199 RepID=UPI003714DC79